MTTEQTREIFNKVIATETDTEQIAKLEVAREFFTNPEFKKNLEQFVWEQNQSKK